MWPGGEGGGFVGNERSVTAAGVLAVLGTILFVGTIAWMAAIWSHLGRGDSVLALWIGLPPSMTCLGLSSLLEWRTPLPGEPTPLRRKLRRGTFAAFAVVIAVLAGGHAAFHFNRARCVAQVEARVEAMFRADATGKLGPFQSMTGEGWSESFWDLTGSGAIVCEREGQFTKGTFRIRIRVTPLASPGDDADGAGVPQIDGIDTQGIHVSINHAELWR